MAAPVTAIPPIIPAIPPRVPSLAWVTEIAREASVESDLHDFFVACMDHPAERQALARAIRGLHLATWDVFSNVAIIEGAISCNSMLLFLLVAENAPEVDDPRTPQDFPLLKIDAVWTHDVEPVSRMTMQVVTDTLYGLEWIAFSDVFAERRSPAFIAQVRELFYLVRSRILFMVRDDALPTSVMDVEEFRTKTVQRKFKALDTRDLDYDSGEDAMPRKRMRMAEDKSELNRQVGQVTPEFVHDMDAMLVAFERALMRYDLDPAPDPEPREVGPAHEASRAKMSRFRSWVYDNTRRLDEKRCLDAQRFWIEEMQVTPVHERIFRRIHGQRTPVIRRQIVVCKAEHFVKHGRSNSFEELSARPVSRDTAPLLRINADSMFNHLCNQGTTVGQEGMVRALMSKGLIVRDRLRNTWVVKLGERRQCARSFIHAFRALRAHMRPVTHVDKMDVSVYDSHFF